MMVTRVFILLIFLRVALGYRELTNEEYYSLPSAYHLDDYTKCTDLQEGIYCVGKFELQPLHKHNEKYALTQALTENHHFYNHTRTHQGLCISSTCAHIKHKNNTYRFEKCVNEWASTYDMKATFKNFYYCHTRQDITKLPELDTPKVIFLIVSGILVALNVAGTLHDYSTRGDKSKRNKFLMAWSVPVNYEKISTCFNHKDPRLQNLEPIQGLRFLIMNIVILVHVGFITYQTGMLNIRLGEEVNSTAGSSYFKGCLPMVQAFIMITSFLTTYFLLISGKQLSLKQIPVYIIKRIIRICPIHLLAVGFAATWWVDIAKSPNWPVVVNVESQVCRDKFWLHAFSLNNIIDVDHQCLAQTWSVATDVQLFIILSLMLVILTSSKLSRKTCMYILTGMIVAGYVLVYILGYIYGIKPMEYVTTPENLIYTYHGVPSFGRYYIAPWASFPSCLMGILIAYLLHHIQETGYKLEEQKWFVMMYKVSLPIALGLWPMFGATHEPFQSPHAISLYLVAERGVAVFFYAIFLLGICYGIESPIRRFFSWTIWQPITKLSFGFLMGHWIVLSFYITGSVMPVHNLGIAMTFVGVVMSLLVSLPLTVLVEVPMQRFLNLVIFNNDK